VTSAGHGRSISTMISLANLIGSEMEQIRNICAALTEKCYWKAKVATVDV